MLFHLDAVTPVQGGKGCVPQRSHKEAFQRIFSYYAMCFCLKYLFEEYSCFVCFFLCHCQHAVRFFPRESM